MRTRGVLFLTLTVPRDLVLIARGEVRRTQPREWIPVEVHSILAI